jgi:diguanylate cyclase (GGDEF)-like protein
MTISIGLASLVFVAMLLAQMLGLFPDERAALAESRSELATTVAVACSQYLDRDDPESMSVFVADVVRRNQDVSSAAIRSASGNVLLECGEHVNHWPDLPPDVSRLNYVQIPLFANNQRWGRVELRFQPPHESSIPGISNMPWFKALIFVGLVAFLFFLLYLRRVLQHLDPMSVIPERVRVMMNTLAEAIFILDADGRIVFVNTAFSSLVDIPDAKLQGRNPEGFEWISPDSEQAPPDFPWTACLNNGEASRGTPMRLRAKGRSLHTLSINVAGIAGPDKKIRGALVTLDDMTQVQAKNVQLQSALESLDKAHQQLAEKSEELERLASRDPLTSFFNRRAFFSAAEEILKTACREEKHVGCIMIDLDHFKSINDTYGHQAGDEVLRRTADAITDVLRDTDIVGRYGGEEFAVILPEQDGQRTQQVAERIRKSIEEWPMPDRSMTASIGVASAAPWRDVATLPNLIAVADKALYEAKETGRNKVVAGSPENGPTRRENDHAVQEEQ